MCMLPFGSSAILVVREVRVTGREWFGWEEVGVGGAVVVTDTFSTDRQGMG